MYYDHKWSLIPGTEKTGAIQAFFRLVKTVPTTISVVLFLSCAWSKFSCAISPSEKRFAHMVFCEPSRLPLCKSNISLRLFTVCPDSRSKAENLVEVGGLPTHHITDDPVISSVLLCCFGVYECLSSVLKVLTLVMWSNGIWSPLPQLLSDVQSKGTVLNNFCNYESRDTHFMQIFSRNGWRSVATLTSCLCQRGKWKPASWQRSTKNQQPSRACCFSPQRYQEIVLWAMLFWSLRTESKHPPLSPLLPSWSSQDLMDFQKYLRIIMQSSFLKRKKFWECLI